MQNNFNRKKELLDCFKVMRERYFRCMKQELKSKEKNVENIMKSHSKCSGGFGGGANLVLSQVMSKKINAKISTP